MAIYIVMNVGTFAVIVAMRRNGKAVEEIDDLAGLGRTDPAMALWMAVFMFSMAGIPPLAGFFGKLYVFLAAVQGGFWVLAIDRRAHQRGVGLLLPPHRQGDVFRPGRRRRAGPRSRQPVRGDGGQRACSTLFFILWPTPMLGAAGAAAAALLG